MGRAKLIRTAHPLPKGHKARQQVVRAFMPREAQVKAGVEVADADRDGRVRLLMFYATAPYGTLGELLEASKALGKVMAKVKGPLSLWVPASDLVMDPLRDPYSIVASGHNEEFTLSFMLPFDDDEGPFVQDLRDAGLRLD